MILRKIESKDIPQIISIHQKTFSGDHFTAHFNNDLLEKYFRKLSQNEFTICAAGDEGVLGYLFAGFHPEKHVDEFVKENRISIIKLLLLNPHFLLEKLMEKIRSYKGNAPHEEMMSLFLIGVKPEAKNQGVGKKLIFYFESELMKEHIDEYELSVRKQNESAIKFYYNTGFTLTNENRFSFQFKKRLMINGK